MSDRPLWSDAPLDHPGEDVIGHAPFAFRLAEMIATGRFAAGYVIALTGEWGSGKSTTVGFTQHFLRQRPRSEKWADTHLIQFNPWWFDRSDDLTVRFFEQIQAEVAESGSISTEVKQAINALFESLRRRRGYGSPRHISRLKRDVDQAMRGWEGRILVTIDDLDRLSTGEIREVFRLIKAVGDFPGFIYLVCYDENVVMASLDDVVHGQKGSVYLEKIVQLPLRLPPPTAHGLTALVNHGLGPLAGLARAQGLAEQDRLNRMHWGSLVVLLDTPRRIKRVVANLAASYPAVASEVSFVDVVGLAALRERAPAVYQSIINRPSDYMGQSTFSLNREKDREEARSRLDRSFEEVGDSLREAVRKLITTLFPNCPAGEQRSYSGDRAEWPKARRICASEGNLRLALRMELEPGQLGRARFRELVDPIRDELRGWLADPECAGALGEFLTHLELEEDRLDSDAKAYVMGSVMLSGEAGWSLMNTARIPGASLFPEVSRGMMRLIHRWLAALDRPELVEKLCAAASLSWSSQLVQQACWAHGRNTPVGGEPPETYRRGYPELLDSPATDRLRDQQVERIRHSTRDALQQIQGLTELLYAYQRLTDKIAMNQLAIRVTDEIGLTVFLERFVPGSTNGVPTWKAESNDFHGERTAYFQRLEEALPDLRSRVESEDIPPNPSGTEELVGLLRDWFAQREPSAP